MIASTRTKDSVTTNLPALYQRALQCDDVEERGRFLKEGSKIGGTGLLPGRTTTNTSG